jgi:hypothetical protein
MYSMSHNMNWIESKTIIVPFALHRLINPDKHGTNGMNCGHYSVEKHLPNLHLQV